MQTVKAALAKSPSPLPAFTWQIINTTQVSHADLTAMVDHGDYHVAFVTTAGATSRLVAALQDPTKAADSYLEMIFDEGRGGIAIPQLLRQIAMSVETLTNAGVGSVLFHDLLAAGGSFAGVDLKTASASVLGDPLTIRENNLHRRGLGLPGCRPGHTAAPPPD